MGKEADWNTAGKAIVHNMWGDPVVNGMEAQSARAGFGAAMGQEAMAIFSEVFARPGLSQRERSLVTLSVLVAMRGGMGEQVRRHIEGAFANGLTPEELEEVCLQIARYNGYPNASMAFTQVQEVAQERGLLR